MIINEPKWKSWIVETTSPLFTFKDALFKAVIPPKRFVTFSNSIIGCI